MKMALILLGIFSVVTSFFTRITEMNKLKESASRAYYQGDYLSASLIYQELQRKYSNKDEKLLINLSHSLFQASKYGEAAFYYERLRHSENPATRSIALNQLGIIASNSGDEKLSVKYFRLAIVEDPSNLKAIYNYEVLRKTSAERKSNKQNQKTDQQPESSGIKGRGKKIGSITVEDGGDEGDESSAGGKGRTNGSESSAGDRSGKSDAQNKSEKEKKNNANGDKTKQDIVSNKLKKFGISPSQAYQILESMKREEIIYLQQIRHKSTDRKQTGPDY
jgi:hypothetical protein